MSPSRSPSEYQSAVRHSGSLNPAHPQANKTDALLNRLRITVVGFISALVPALHVARHVDLDPVRGAFVLVVAFLALQAEDRVAKTEVVPVGFPAFHLSHACAGRQEQAQRGRPIADAHVMRSGKSQRPWRRPSS